VSSAADRVSLLRDLTTDPVGEVRQTAGWCWTFTRSLLVAERSPEGAAHELPARSLRLLTTPLGAQEYDVAALLAFVEAHAPQPAACETCHGTGRRVRTCSHCENTHDCTCTACDGRGDTTPSTYDLGAVVCVGDVCFRALAAAPVLRWLIAVGATRVRLARVDGALAQEGGPALVLGDDTRRVAVSSVDRDAIDLITPTFEVP